MIRLKGTPDPTSRIELVDSAGNISALSRGDARLGVSIASSLTLTIEDYSPISSLLGDRVVISVGGRLPTDLSADDGFTVRTDSSGVDTSTPGVYYERVEATSDSDPSQVHTLSRRVIVR